MPTTILQDTPPALVEGGGLHEGFFRTPFRRANLLDADLMGGALARPLRWLRLKEWNGVGVGHPGLFGGILHQDAKVAVSATVYLYDREADRMWEWTVLDRPRRRVLPETTWHGASRCGNADRFLSLEHDLDHGRHRVRARFPAGRGTPSVAVDLELRQDLREFQPLVFSLRIPPGHHTYTHKSPLRLDGTIDLGGRVFRFDPARDLGNLDEQKTFYPYRSHWLWGCFAGRSSAGREVVLNLVNQMTPKDLPGEDAMWLDGRLMLLPRPAFEPAGAPGHFRVRDPQGRVRLRFTPAGSKPEFRDFGLIRMDYRQFFGRWDGEVVDEDGLTHRIDGCFGCLERMDARF